MPRCVEIVRDLLELPCGFAPPIGTVDSAAVDASVRRGQRQLLGGDHLATVADRLVHAVRVIGADHVALGLDMEEVTASVLPPELQDMRELPKRTALLLGRST